MHQNTKHLSVAVYHYVVTAPAGFSHVMQFNLVRQLFSDQMILSQAGCRLWLSAQRHKGGGQSAHVTRDKALLLPSPWYKSGR